MHQIKFLVTGFNNNKKNLFIFLLKEELLTRIPGNVALLRKIQVLPPNICLSPGRSLFVTNPPSLDDQTKTLKGYCDYWF